MHQAEAKTQPLTNRHLKLRLTSTVTLYQPDLHHLVISLLIDDTPQRPPKVEIIPLLFISFASYSSCAVHPHTRPNP